MQQTLELIDGIADLPRDDWNALVGDESPFLEWEWLASLEHAGAVGQETGWLPKPLVLREGDRLLAACPMYVKGNSEGEFVFDYSWADAAYRAGIDYYPKLLVGVPFTPVTGGRFLVAPGVDRPQAVRQLAAALREICRGNDMSSVHVNFCREDEVATLVDLDEKTSESEYQLRVGFQYHWRNDGFRDFDDYLARFRSKRRNQIKRERRGMAEQEVEIEIVRGDAITEDLFEPMYRCYLSTIEARHWGRQYLNPHFFELLHERFRHRLCFVVAKREGEVIAGTTNVVKGDGFYGRYWGALQEVRHLHFNVCYYAAIEYCIEAGIGRFEPGAGGDYKYLRGFDAQPTFSLHYVAEPRLSQAIASFLDAERAEAQHVIDHLRQNSVLKSAGDAPREGS